MSAAYLPLLISAAAFLISLFSLFFFRMYLKRRTGQERILAELREEVNNLLKTIDETTERDISLIEERGKNLRGLLLEVDRRFTVYTREMEKRKDADNSYAELRKKGPVPPDITPSAAEAKPAGYTELGKNRYRAGPGKAAPGSSEAPPEREDSAEAFPLPDFKIREEAFPAAAPPDGRFTAAPGNAPAAAASVSDQIRELLRAGFAPQAIASRLGISIAEAEFAEALFGGAGRKS